MKWTSKISKMKFITA